MAGRSPLPTHTVLFAGGGSGGHIFPNMAVLERLRERRIPIAPHFLISHRPLDIQIMRRHGLPFTCLPAEPVGLRPDRLIRFYRGFREAESVVKEIIKKTNASAMAATGGFISGPAVAAARKMHVPTALVNLDAVPGRANQFIASKAGAVFTVYPTTMLSGAHVIGLPMRRAAVRPVDAGEARQELGLDPQHETLLIFAGSQGGATVNRMMMEMCSRARPRGALANSQLQVLHLSGAADEVAVRRAYDGAGIKAVVAPFCHAMGLAWSAATLAITRAGAGTVGEAWANQTPTLFLPYPYHKDEHQRLNAEPLTKTGGALIFHDRIDPIANVEQIVDPLLSLMADAGKRDAMRQALRQSQPEDGAQAVARWLEDAMT